LKKILKEEIVDILWAWKKWKKTHS
jgi:hypothetical protein